MYGLDNLFTANNTADGERTISSQSYQSQYTKFREIVVSHYRFRDNVVAVAITGDTWNQRRYINGEDVHITSDGTTLQCPILFKYTSTEKKMIQDLHISAMTLAKQKKIALYEDSYASPWLTNGRAYVLWAVGPKEVQQEGSSKYFKCNQITIIYC
jgi:hypothetical protein